jgi:hypothetical protein
MRLAQLVHSRDKPASARARFPREFEVKVTHPFVFAALEETRLPLQRLLVGASLHLYTENAGKIANKLMHRNADAMLFGDAEMSVSKFDARARRDSLVAVEAKRCLNAQGQVGCARGRRARLCHCVGRQTERRDARRHVGVHRRRRVVLCAHGVALLGPRRVDACDQDIVGRST